MHLACLLDKLEYGHILPEKPIKRLLVPYWDEKLNEEGEVDIDYDSGLGYLCHEFQVEEIYFYSPIGYKFGGKAFLMFRHLAKYASKEKHLLTNLYRISAVLHETIPPMRGLLSNSAAISITWCINEPEQMNEKIERAYKLVEQLNDSKIFEGNTSVQSMHFIYVENKETKYLVDILTEKDSIMQMIKRNRGF